LDSKCGVFRNAWRSRTLETTDAAGVQPAASKVGTYFVLC
jgi:hypothetical protein